MNNQQTPLILQINSLAALERLLGNGENTEFELAVRNSVAQAFANRHFNAFSKLPEIQRAENEGKALAESARKDLILKVQTALELEIGKFQKEQGYPYKEYLVLKPETAEKIKALARQEVSEIISKTVKEKIASMDIPALIESQIKYQLDTGIQKIITDKVSEKLISIKNSI